MRTRQEIHKNMSKLCIYSLLRCLVHTACGKSAIVALSGNVVCEPESNWLDKFLGGLRSEKAEGAGGVAILMSQH